MPLDFATLEHLKRSHPSWRLMQADNAPLIASFLDREFRENNVRMQSETELVLHLEDFIRSIEGFETGDADQVRFPRSAQEYLNDWAQESRGWLRKFYPPASDVPHYDLTPEAEKALSWLEQLSGRRFLGTEGRLNHCFELLRQIVHGVEENADLRLADLKIKKAAIEKEIARLQAGELSVLDDRELRERFWQFGLSARELLGDFRAVEQHFIDLDRSIREQIALWDGEKSEMLETILERHDSIRDSDEGQSFRAFWDFLMSPASQDELETLLDRVYQIDELGDYLEDRRLRRVHHDWIKAGEQTQRRVAQLSAQLRRYLDDRTLQENRRILDLLKNIEKTAVELRESPPPQALFMAMDGSRPDISVPMEYPLFSPPLQVVLDSSPPALETEELDMRLLLEQASVDRARLEANIAHCLETSPQASLATIVTRFPLELSLAELVTYFLIASEGTEHIVSDEAHEQLEWHDAEHDIVRQARVPLILFGRKNP